MHNPHVKSVDLVERDTERSVFLFQKLDALDCLRLQRMHHVDDEHCHITKGASSCSKISERFVTWGVDDEETR